MNSSSAADPKTKFTYDQHILPILTAHCVGCHKGESAKGGLDLSTFAKLKEGGASGEVLKPGDADGSRLWRVTAHKEQPFMPPKMPMIDKEKVDTLALWIQQGALENAGSKPIAVKPKAEVGLMSVKRGKPDVAPMPEKPLRTEPVVTTAKPNAVIALAASPWAPLVAVGGVKQVMLFHGDTLALVGVLPFPHGTPTVLKFSRNGGLLLAGGGRGGQSGRVVVWDVKTGEQIIEVGNETDAVLAADISADQQLIALGGPSKMLRIYATKDGSLVREVKKHTDWIYAVEFSPDAVLLASADRSGGLMVWEAATGREFYNLRGHQAGVLDVSWRDDSNVLASCSEDTTIKLWEMENGNQIKTWGAHAGGAQAVKFSHDNRLVSTGRDKVTKIWDMNGAAQKTFPPHADVALRAAFNHDGTKVYSGDWTGAVQEFNVADAKLLAQATTNPMTPAQALDLATKTLAAKQTAFDAANNAYTPAAQKAAATAADLAPAQKLATDSANIAKAAADQTAALKANLDKAQAALAPAQAKAMAADVKAKAFAGAHAQIQAAADANKGNADLQATAAQSKAMADQATAELAAATKAVTDATNAVNAANAAYGPAAQNAQLSAASAKLAADIVAPRAAAAKLAGEAVGPLKANLDRATAELNAAKAEMDKVKAAATPPKKG
ncbi:MAG TPA: c-type cytochrome domain-containing protein [Gemmataceae bacterium]|nr:c-type cytochrome domain-containing protein [Gemmataceae bacterium]